jgi:branched-chain amino acid transport system substrate-binding protein
MNTTRKIFITILLASTVLCAWAQDGVTDNKIVIGQTIGVTGTIAGPVKEMLEGANAYIRSVNEHGGVNGRKIELRVLDDKFDPKLAAENAEILIKDQHVFALFQSRGTPHTQALLPILEANQVPLIAPSTGAMLFHKPVNHLVFNVRPKYQTEVAKAIEHLDTIGLKEIGFLYVDDIFGLDGLDGFNQTMAARHLTPTIITKFARVKPDYAAVAASIVKANPKAVIIVSSSSNTIEVIKAIRAQGGQMQLLTLSNNSSQGFIKDLGTAGYGVVITQVTPPPHMVSTTLGQEFRVAAKATDTTVSYAAMEGFVAAKVLVEGLRRAGRNLTRATFIQAMETMQRVDLGGMTVNYSGSNHSGSEFVELTMITKSGRLAR